MIPWVASVRIKRGPSVWSFHVPLILLWVLLLPVAILLAPFLLIACLIFWVSPIRTVAVIGEILGALRGTHVEFTESERTILVSLK